MLVVPKTRKPKLASESNDEKNEEQTKGRKRDGNERKKEEQEKRKFEVIILSVLLSIICQSLQYLSSRGQIQSYDLYIIILTYVSICIIRVRIFQKRTQRRKSLFCGKERFVPALSRLKINHRVRKSF